MRCPYCRADDTRVVDSRPADDGAAIRRRRECASCERRFTTFERMVFAAMVRKRDGTNEPFVAEKIRTGIERASADRPIPAEALDELVRTVETMASAGEMLSTEVIGRAVLDQLREIDEVAYLRFASVYKEFQGAQDFEREMATLEED